MDLLDRLLEHDQWATTTLLNLSQSLTADQIVQRFDVGHKTLHETFGHLIFNIEFWTASMTGSPFDAKPEDYASFPALNERFQQSFATFATFSRQIRDEERIDDTFTDQFGYPMTYGGAILHVILHDAEHRTEVVHILTRLEVPEIPEVDHGLWDFVRRGLAE